VVDGVVWCGVMSDRVRVRERERARVELRVGAGAGDTQCTLSATHSPFLRVGSALECLCDLGNSPRQSRECWENVAHTSTPFDQDARLDFAFDLCP